jgi:type II secretory pathway pseudopilin PulG
MESLKSNCARTRFSMIQRSDDSIVLTVMTFRPTEKARRSERGYILLILMLSVALLTIAALSWVEKVDFQIKRDREEELVHRGVQYSRAVRRYFKKFGRYPTRIEELENTNNQRFLRKKYKDPITGKDFKVLRLTDVQMSFNSTPTGFTPISQMNGGLQPPGAPGGLNGMRPGLGGGPGSSTTATNSNPANDNVRSSNQGDGSQSDASQAEQAAGPQGEGATPPPPQPLSQQAGPGGAPQVFGGGAIVGVASLSKLKTIREFNKKDHYNQWQFIYDPMTDRGGLLMTPNQPPLQGTAQNQQQQQNGQPGATGQGFSFGQNGMNPAPQEPQQPQQPNPAQPEQQ